jgi:3-dehydrosphinganine reductase
MKSFDGARVVITGGSRGIGLATAQQLAAQGAQVCIAARTERMLEEARAAIVAKVPSAQGRVHAVALDVREDTSVEAGVARALERLGGLDLLVNNAGYAAPGYLDQVPLRSFEDMLQVNYLGTVRTVRAALPHLIRQGHGHIVNVASMLGFMGMLGYSAYAGSKFAVAGFTECLRQELRPRGIGVSICYPPTTRTPGLERENQSKPAATWALEGSSRAFAPDEVARAIVRGVQRGQYEILVGLDSALVWRLQRHSPPVLRWLLDRMLTKHLRSTGGELR